MYGDGLKSIRIFTRPLYPSKGVLRGKPEGNHTYMGGEPWNNESSIISIIEVHMVEPPTKVLTEALCTAVCEYIYDGGGTFPPNCFLNNSGV